MRMQVLASINSDPSHDMGAYDMIDTDMLTRRLQAFLPRINIRVSEPTKFDFATGLKTHYHVLSEADYGTIK